jgi:FkbM family methyltransferase
MAIGRLLSGLLSGSAVRFLPDVPRAVLLFRNWAPLLLAYAGVAPPPREAILRSGARIRIHDRLDVTTILVVWVRKDYGDPPASGTVVDIGANIGAFAMLAAARGSRVVAFEPMPENFARLGENVRRNGLERLIIAESRGVAGEVATRRLYVGSGSPYHSIHSADPDARHVEMETTTLDAIFEKHEISACDLLKVDCEGAEFEILYAASPDTMKRVREIRLEYHDRRTPERHNVAALEAYLAGQGFRRVKKVDSSCMLWMAREGA